MVASSSRSLIGSVRRSAWSIPTFELNVVVSSQAPAQPHPGRAERRVGQILGGRRHTARNLWVRASRPGWGVWPRRVGAIPGIDPDMQAPDIATTQLVLQDPQDELMPEPGLQRMTAGRSHQDEGVLLDGGHPDALREPLGQLAREHPLHPREGAQRSGQGVLADESANGDRCGVAFHHQRIRANRTRAAPPRAAGGRPALATGGRPST